MTAPCWLNEPDPADPDWPGSPCCLEMGFCMTCGKRDEFNWAAMSHEVYGLWIGKDDWKKRRTLGMQ